EDVGVVALLLQQLQDDRHRLPAAAEKREAFGLGQAVLRDGILFDLEQRLLKVGFGVLPASQGELGLRQIQVDSDVVGIDLQGLVASRDRFRVATQENPDQAEGGV